MVAGLFLISPSLFMLFFLLWNAPKPRLISFTYKICSYNQVISQRIWYTTQYHDTTQQNHNITHYLFYLTAFIHWKWHFLANNILSFVHAIQQSTIIVFIQVIYTLHIPLEIIFFISEVPLYIIYLSHNPSHWALGDGIASCLRDTSSLCVFTICKESN